MIHARRSTRFKTNYNTNPTHHNTDSSPNRTERISDGERNSAIHILLSNIPQNINLCLDHAFDVQKRSIRVIVFQSHLSILAKLKRSVEHTSSCHTLALHTQNTYATLHTHYVNDPFSDRLVLNHSNNPLDHVIISVWKSCLEICLTSRLYLVALFTIKLILISLVALFHNLVVNYSASQPQHRFLSFYCDIRLKLSVANASSSYISTIVLTAAWPTAPTERCVDLSEFGAESLVKAGFLKAIHYPTISRRTHIERDRDNKTTYSTTICQPKTSRSQ